ncbi:hypothetical protein [Clavibacter michiganensis]|uniref:hypothetical protein n=1 Tax=Clavibacter michiganensis TaxID=28447 RepID=UPI0011B038ED|nr:hypothetical protein [Clavibacter michiganensis]
MATDALARAESRLISDQVLALPGQFGDIGAELDYVYGGGAEEVARFALLRLHGLCNESSSILAGLDSDQSKLIKKIERLGRTALKQKGALGGDDSAKLLVRDVISANSDVRGGLTKLTADIKNRVSANAIEAK